jgi:arsenate reductase
MVYDIKTELLEDSLLLKTPIVRNGMQATIGYKPEIWKEWISLELN